ncbi:MAG: hypothetical protein IJK26_03390 [Clostridia bacterium]|nr:hypothetical protein [Clostridia bacterium]
MFTTGVLTGIVGFYIVAAVFKVLSGILMAIAINKACKIRAFSNRTLWTFCAWLAPFATAICYFLYNRFTDKYDNNKRLLLPEEQNRLRKLSKFVIASVISFTVYAIIVVVSVIIIITSSVFGIANGEIDLNYYDRYGNSYNTESEVVLYDRDGNKYYQENDDYKPSGLIDYITSKTFAEDGTVYKEKIYLDEDGYIYYDKDNTLIYEAYDRYAYDGQGKAYYPLTYTVYWDKDGKMWAGYGKTLTPLFDDSE